MKLQWIAVLGAGLVVAQAGAEETGALKTGKQQVSYAVGATLARNVQQQGIELDVDALLQGLRDVLTNQSLRMSEAEIQKGMATAQVEAKQKRMQAKATRSRDAQANKIEGETFLAQNKTKDGVVELPSGLQYKILKTGNGKIPTDADTVEVHYRGTLLNGAEFDSSYARGKPSTFQVKGVIPGWTEALKLMPVGSKWQLFVPPQLAYGAQGAGQDIGPNETLVFEVELLAIR
jgi:FKBP-type peptidyl-prolyl cis-trans isomerase FklB